jgi:hypothetical protein
VPVLMLARVGRRRAALERDLAEHPAL